MSFFSERLDEDFVQVVKGETKTNVIQELDMLAVLSAVHLWCESFDGFRFVIFTESEAVRKSFLKT